MSTVTRKAGVTVRPTTPGEIRWYPEAASQSFKKGQFVYLASGKLTACAADPTWIAGMAEADASGTTDTAIPITLAKRGQQFTVHSNGTTAVTQVGAHYALAVTSNICYVNVSDVSDTCFIVDDIASDDAVGDTYGRLIVEVLDHRMQLGQTTS
jgi:hypothetical protein